MKLLPSQCILCTLYNHAPCHFMQSHIRKVHAYLTVTCPLHFWQNGQGLLHATVVTRGWNRYWNKSQHRKLTLEKTILPPLLQGFKPTTFLSWAQHFNHWAITAPQGQRSHDLFLQAKVHHKLSVNGFSGNCLGHQKWNKNIFCPNTSLPANLPYGAQ